MADENLNKTAPEVSRADERITELSEKVKKEAEARTAAEAKIAELEKKTIFAEGYADFLSQNPIAREFKQQIHEKVMAGMSVEDAGYAVLGKAGKLGATQVEVQSPAGGSATTTISQGKEKTPQEMTQAERRAELEKNLIFT